MSTRDARDKEYSSNEMRDSEFDGRPGLVAQRARAIILQRLAIGVVVLFMVASMSVLVYNALVSIATRAELLDCTDPTGQCYQEGQKQTAAIIQQLIDANKLGDVATQRVVVLAAACGAGLDPALSFDDRVLYLTDCVTAQLKEDKENAK